MRRVFSFLLVTFLLLSLCACHVDDNTTTAPSNTNANTNTTAPSGTTAPPVDVDITVKTDGWINAESITERNLVFAYGGCYYLAEMGSSFLSFLDVNNGISVVLCSKPGCKHHEETSVKKAMECDAYLSHNTVFLHLYDDKIYYAGNDDGYGGYDLYRRNIDGTGMEKVAELGLQYVTQKSSISIVYYIPAGSKLYYKVDVQESTKNENGISTVETVKRALMCYDLNTGKEVLIQEFVEDAPHMIAARDNQLLFYTVPSSSTQDRNDPDYKEKLNTRPTRLKVWDESVGQTDTVFEKTYAEWKGKGFVADGKYYYSARTQDEEGNDVYGMFAYDLGTEKVETADITGMPLDGRYSLKHDSENGEDYFYDLQTQTRLPNEFAAQNLYIEDMGDEGFILSKGYNKAEMTDDGGKIGDYTVYAYVTYDALTDGLQASDCLDFYTKHYGE